MQLEKRTGTGALPTRQMSTEADSRAGGVTGEGEATVSPAVAEAGRLSTWHRGSVGGC